MTQESTSEIFRINNAGIVILTPFLPSLFSRLHLVENGQFTDESARIKAIYLMIYSIYGVIDVQNNELKLFKILAALDVDVVMSSAIEITDNEKGTVDTMLNSVIQHWSKIGNTSIEGLRESFLKREGKLEEKDDYYILDVEHKSYDMLLDSIPWSFGIMRFPWMVKTIRVNWR